MVPLVSVVMAVHNCERYVGQAIDSILCQSFGNFEFIIVNDASTDRTEEIIKSYRDQRVIFIVNKENIGQTKSLNEGIRLSRGKYIARMDGDDVALPARLTMQVEFMERNPRIGVVGTWVELIDSRNITKQCLRYPLVPNVGRLLLLNLLHWPCLAHPTTMIRKKVFTDVGLYDEKYFISQDYDLWLRVARGFSIRNIPCTLLKYRENRESLSRKEIEETKKEMADIVLSNLRFYTSDLHFDDEDILLNLLLFKRQKSARDGRRCFEILNNFLQIISKREKDAFKT